MKGYRQLVETAVEAVTIHSQTSYSWFNQVAHQLPERVEAEMTPATARAYLHYAMQSHLYENFYCRGRAVPVSNSYAWPVIPRFSPFVKALSASNSGSGTREPGWQVRGVENRTVVVENHGLSLWVPLEHTWPRVRGALLPNKIVSVSFPNELLQLSPGFYMALGNRWLDVEQGPVLRLYWHLRSEGADRLIAAATARLNRDRLPFRLKVVNEPERYTRCDAGVLYTRKRDYSLLARLLHEVYAAVSPYLEQATPAFTKRLAPGLGLAEDPGSSESFGMHRCGLLAEGLIRAHEQAKQSVAERMTIVDECFEQAGVRLAAPFLNPGSSDRYEFSVN